MWQQITSFSNLYLAYKKAKKGKASRPEVAEFSFDLERNLLVLSDELQKLRWWPGKYRHFTIYERKQRTITAAPFRDRVVHHAIMNVVGSDADSIFSSHCYACRTCKGVHRAVDQYQQWAKHYKYVIKLDVKRYFPSIDHRVIKNQLKELVSDNRVFMLFDRIIDAYEDQSGKGMAIGNLTSQFFANLYLNEFDHWVNNDLGITAYLRYVDDFVLLANDKNELWSAAERIALKLNDVKLILHPNKIQVRRTSEKVDMFGYQVSPNKRWLRNDNGHRFRRRLNNMAVKFARNEMNFSDVTPCVNSWIGHAQHGETSGLREQIFKEVIFKRA